MRFLIYNHQLWGYRVLTGKDNYQNKYISLVDSENHHFTAMLPLKPRKDNTDVIFLYNHNPQTINICKLLS